MTDPRAALAEALAAYPYLVGPVADRLAERGVLLVTEERLAAALRQVPMLRAEEPIDYAAAILAALSGKDEAGEALEHAFYSDPEVMEHD